MTARKPFQALFLAIVLCFPAYSLAEMIQVQGTIQGLMSFCESKMCTPGEEMIIAAMEETYVLATAEGGFYLLPNIKTTQLSRHLGKTVRVEGEPKLNGRAIMAKRAEVKKDEKWRTFFDRDILEKGHSYELYMQPY